jgi:uncharacterized protein
MQLDRDEIVRRTEEYGGAWGLNHTRRLLKLVQILGEGLCYDDDVVWLAAHLHDWGAYAAWAQPGVDHAARSAEVAADFLGERACPPDTLAAVVECIATHHSGDPERRLEAVLLSDADGLDFLGAVGVLRDFSKAPRDLRRAYDAARMRQVKVPGCLCLERSRALARERLTEMEALLQAFRHSSFDLF